MIITNTSFESPYIEQLLVFLQSLKMNSPKDVVNVLLVNYSIDKERMLKNIFSKFKFENRTMEILEDKRFSFIIFRAMLIKEYFEKYKSPVAWIDTDVIIRKDLSEFLQIESNQLKILYRGLPLNPGPADSPINAGIFNIGYSEATYDFICDWYKGCLANPVWGQGQMIFWNMYKKYSDEIELIKMPNKFNDIGGNGSFSSESVMWHCKQKHFNNPIFQKEFQIYLKKVVDDHGRIF